MIPEPTKNSTHRRQLPCGTELHWPLEPYQLVSMLDMLRFDMRQFCIIMHHMADLEGALFARDGSPDGLGVKPLSAYVTDTRTLLMQIGNLCDKMELRVSSGQAEVAYISAHLRSFAELANDLENVHQSIVLELKGRLFQYIPTGKDIFFSKQPGFGALVKSKFPEFASDIEDAKRCLGCDLPTAALFI